MLPALPTEILKQIIESAVPRSFQTETYSARQETLRTLSLVSKRFHAIARPLLCQVAWIKSMKQFKTLHKSAAGAGQGRAAKNWFTIRAIIGSDSHTCFSRHLSIGPQLGQMVSIRHLTLSGLRADIVDWDLLASLPNLISLTVSQLEWDETDRIAPLPNLERLAVVFLWESTQLAFFDPVNVPNLRHLIVRHDELEEPALAALNDILPRLETIQLDFSVWCQLDSVVRGEFIDHMLVIAIMSTFDHCGQLLTTAKHIQIVVNSTVPMRDRWTAESVREVAHWIVKTSPCIIETLYLASAPSKFELTSPILFSAIHQLESACRERKVDVVYEEGPSQLDFDPWISLDFIVRQEAARERLKTTSG
ncbi:hypothetical protein JCM3766R1_001573 [Sporobolomyces carnicolor]